MHEIPLGCSRNFTNCSPGDAGSVQDAAENWGSVGLLDGDIHGRPGNKLTAMFSPKSSRHLTKFNVRTIYQIAQRAVLTRIPEKRIKEDLHTAADAMHKSRPNLLYKRPIPRGPVDSHDVRSTDPPDAT